MQKKKTALVAILTALALLLRREAVSAEIKLEKAFPEAEGRGEVEITRTSFATPDRLLTVNLHKLKPNSVYSVWLVDKYAGERTPAGLTGQNHLRTDSAGNAVYKDHTSEYRLDRNTIEIAYHPDGDPGNVKDMVVILRARLYI